MKRFFLIVSVTVCSLFLFSQTVFAEWRVDIETKTVSQGATGVTVNLTAYWDLVLNTVSVPVIVRSTAGGAFWVPPLPVDDGGPVVGVQWNWSNPGWANLVEMVGVGQLGCDPAGDIGYDGTSPDHFVVNAALATGAGTPAEPTGRDFVILTIDVNSSVGTFEFDTACYTSSLDRIFLIDNVNYEDHGPGAPFNKGVITIQENQCPDGLGSYGSPVEDKELANMSNPWNSAGYSDNEGDDARFYLSSGPGQVNETSGLWTWTPQCCTSGTYLAEIEVADDKHASLGSCPNNILSFTVIVNPWPVGIVCPANITVHFGTTASGQVTATTPCTPVTFAQMSGPGSTTAGGFYTWATTCADIATSPHTVWVKAWDNTGPQKRPDSCSFTVTVTNNPPVCNIVSPPAFMYDQGLREDIAGEVSDPNGDPLTLFGLTWAPPIIIGNQPVLVGDSLIWDPIHADNAPGTFLFTIGVTDDCDTVYCKKTIELLYAKVPDGFKVSIYDTSYVIPDTVTDIKTDVEHPWGWDADHATSALNGTKVTIGVAIQEGHAVDTLVPEGLGAFDLLVCYDPSILTFLQAEKGPAIADWEYFTYRFGPFGNNCGTGCPSGYIRLIGIRDMNDCHEPPEWTRHLNGFIAYLTFRVTEDRSFINLCARVGFCAIDCGDNVLSSAGGDLVFLPLPFKGASFFSAYWGTWSRYMNLHFGEQLDPTGIYFKPDYWWVDPINFVLAEVDANCNGHFVPKVFDDLDTWRLVDYWTPVCWTGELTDENCPIPGKYLPIPWVYFDEGKICIIAPPDDRGDINLNGIANEIGDATLFSNYLIHGPHYGPWYDDGYAETRFLASDINADGVPGNVADLVYLIRIITGDAMPFPTGAKLNPYAVGLDVNSELVDGQMVITTNSTSDLGAGHLVFRYTGLTMGLPETNTDMTVRAHADNGTLRVLVFSMKGNRIDAGVTELVSIPTEGNGTIELVDASFSDASGALMTVDLHRVAPPAAFELMQNYPNPFNASTMIRFALPDASDWSLKVYNVAGQVVESFAGSAEAGYVSVTWNADVASGIYFYRLTAGNFTATKKMVLMK